MKIPFFKSSKVPKSADDNPRWTTRLWSKFSFRLPFKLPSISPITRITLGLVSLGLSLILGFDMVFGLFPRETETARQIRQRVSQNIAVQSTALLDNKDFKTLDRSLTGILAKDPDMLSLGMRRLDGDLVVSSAEHTRYWKSSASGGSTLEHVIVPLNTGGQRWGNLELAFKPPGFRTISDWLTSPPMKLFFAFLFGAGTIFYFYLRRVLQRMDPSSSVPDRVRMAFDTLSEGILILDGNSRAIMVNKSVREMTGQVNEHFIGKDPDQFTWLRSQEGAVESPWKEAIRNREPLLGSSFAVENAKGGLRKVVVNCAPILDAKKAARGCMVTFNDVSALEEAREHLMEVLSDLATSKHQLESQNGELERLASRDSLSGCLNRRAFFDRYERFFSSAKRNNGQLTCIMADIDKFKSINDTHGHAVGDQVIKAFAAILQDEVRGSDLVARYGGEEFCIVLTGADMQAAERLANKIRVRVSEQCGQSTTISGLVVKASFGVSSITLGAKTPAAMVDEADQALYSAKQSGRNRVMTFSKQTEVVV
jgi:diguanylate cyclase (GGDEF)-like protein/PAS domain S-box-containing protein